MSHVPLVSTAYLADARPRTLARDIVLVLIGTLVISVSALVIIPLPFTPVPVALSTFSVLATGAALGSLRGALSAGLYLLIGVAGAPVFSQGQSGVGIPTFGYIIGFVIAAAVVGRLARRGADRRVASTLVLGAVGTFVLYACGVPWLAVSLGVDLSTAVQLGVVPFLLGDGLKIIALGAVLPSAWRLLATVHAEDEGGSR